MSNFLFYNFFFKLAQHTENQSCVWLSAHERTRQFEKYCFGEEIFLSRGTRWSRKSETWWIFWSVWGWGKLYRLFCKYCDVMMETLWFWWLRDKALFGTLCCAVVQQRGVPQVWCGNRAGVVQPRPFISSLSPAEMLATQTFFTLLLSLLVSPEITFGWWWVHTSDDGLFKLL